MIYEKVPPDDPVRQGDIFKNIPQFLFDPIAMKVPIEETGYFKESTWVDEIGTPKVTALVSIRPAYGIVASQDCDTEHRQHISLFKIDECARVIGVTPPQKPEKLLAWWIDRIVEENKLNQAWFYLPPYDSFGFKDRMAADFHTVLVTSAEFLKSSRSNFRLGRLNPEADEHFRERIAQYYRRYPVDEWYPLTKEEFDLYKSKNTRGDTLPKKWQE